MAEINRLYSMVLEMDNDKHVTFDQCLLWNGDKNYKNYGMVDFQNKKYQCHRLVYAWFIGPIKKGMHILHTCDNPSCINPFHLWQGTNQDNVDDKMQKGRYKVILGEKHPRAKLSDEDVELIRSIECLTDSELADLFGCSRSHINNIKRGNKRLN